MNTYDINDFTIYFNGEPFISQFAEQSPTVAGNYTASIPLKVPQDEQEYEIAKLFVQNLRCPPPPPVTLTIPSRKMIYLMGEARRRRFVSPRLAKRMRKEKPNARRFVGVLELPPLAPRDGVREWTVRGDWVR